MIKFNKPTNLNGYELRNELNNAGIKINYGGSEVAIDEDGDFWLDVNSKDKSKVEAIVSAHNGTIIAPDLSTEKQAILDRIGLTADELKTILG